MIDLIRGRGLYQFWTLAHRIVATMIMIVLLIITGVLTVQALDRTLPVKIERIRILPPVVRAGDTINIEFTAVRHRVCETRGEGYIFDGANTRWSYEPTVWKFNQDEIGPETYKIERRMPAKLTPGLSRYRLVLYQRCPLNLFHLIWPIVDVVESEPFDIIAE